ncbi:MAG: hypothetical protein GTO02_15280 [Candidatus Dadabacteria bacterium]|nr:hypothetical protein [Candidatus Dadabacteria bacterium]NIQ15703.1 hypothetical protein [Candidatus Dadabacteria bacterium]
MDIETIKTFFMWCTIINGAIFIYWSLILIFAPDFVYRFQTKWFNVSRESFNVVVYSFLGLTKVLFIFFSLTPYIGLVIIG